MFFVGHVNALLDMRKLSLKKILTILIRGRPMLHHSHQVGFHLGLCRLGIKVRWHDRLGKARGCGSSALSPG